MAKMVFLKQTTPAGDRELVRRSYDSVLRRVVFEQSTSFDLNGECRVALSISTDGPIDYAEAQQRDVSY